MIRKVVNDVLTSTSAPSQKLLVYIMPSPGVTNSSAAARNHVLARMEDVGATSGEEGSSAGDAANGGETAIGAGMMRDPGPTSERIVGSRSTP
jgi:hypothetical protein